MLASIVITLHVDRGDLSLPGLGGEALHGLYFEALRGHDTGFADSLHGLKGEKPISLSSLLTDLPKRDGRTRIPAHTTVAFRLGLLTDDAIERPLAAFTPLVASGRPLRLGGGMAHVRGIACQPGRHPLMRSTS